MDAVELQATITWPNRGLLHLRPESRPESAYYVGSFDGYSCRVKYSKHGWRASIEVVENACWGCDGRQIL